MVVNPKKKVSVVIVKNGKNLDTTYHTKEGDYKEEAQRKENKSQLATSSQKVYLKPPTPFHLTLLFFPVGLPNPRSMSKKGRYKRLFTK